MTSSQSLRNATLEIEKHVSRGGWDGPIRLFALVNARAALDSNPALAQELPADVQADSITDPDVLFSVEQEGLPEVDSLDELLGHIMWPNEVDGAALSVERVVLPPSAEVNLPKDERELTKAIEKHPDRQDVRMVAAVLRTGETWGAIRMKDHDADDMVLSGPDIVEGLTEILKATFE
ncbi:PPA1309 family protein [Arcanobacterium ihumii]|uniref:PPA1309 family protein n=1 Tax=Arcanobacterium ihumii TaxID=2138162 RepID=UPI000F522494|nr:PPA1309 family protein [Arcanobacterium ihumii]